MSATRERTNPKNGNDNRRDDLVRAAAQLFREKGFEGTTIRAIAGAVGMRSGSPFYHFANKHELLMAVMEEGLRLGLKRTRAVVDAPGLNSVERFRHLVRAHYGILHETGSDCLGADARIARLMILGAINFSATWYRTKPRGRIGVDLETLANETVALFLRETPA